MMTRKNGMPRRVYVKHSAFYYVTLDHKWLRLCAEADGMPGVYRALSKLDAPTLERLPSVIAKWLKTAGTDWGSSRRRNIERIAGRLSMAFREFEPGQIRAPDCAEYLSGLRDRPATHNQHRAVLRLVLSHAALLGLRDGHNPVDDVPVLTLADRRRIVTDAEIAAIKRYSGKTGAGRAMCQMIDLAVITGQRIGDLLALRWQDCTTDGVLVTQAKTGTRLCIEWTDELRAAVAACATGTERIGYLLKTRSGTGYSYAGMHSAWVRACVQAGIEDLHIHDLRGRAGVDAQESGGIESARALLGHRTQAMTSHYTRGKSVAKVKPSR